MHAMFLQPPATTYVDKLLPSLAKKSIQHGQSVVGPPMDFAKKHAVVLVVILIIIAVLAGWMYMRHREGKSMFGLSSESTCVPSLLTIGANPAFAVTSELCNVNAPPARRS
jgi:hypothetical protein